MAGPSRPDEMRQLMYRNLVGAHSVTQHPLTPLSDFFPILSQSGSKAHRWNYIYIEVMHDQHGSDWPNYGYDHPPATNLDDGILIANGDADTVRAIFEHRADGCSHAEISRRVGLSQSTVRGILWNRPLNRVGQFDHVVELLAELDWHTIWNEATRHRAPHPAR